jgi:glycosyltransferase involved in cell wall biosynthesis
LKNNKSILFFVNVDWFFVSHFVLVAVEALNKGYDVHILCKVITKKDYLENLGFTVHNIDISRGKINIVRELITLRQVYKSIKEIAPDVIELYTIKPIIYGGIASKLLNIKKKIFYVTGLGYVFINRGFIDSIKINLYKLLYKFSIQGDSTKVIVENSSDEGFIKELNVVNSSKIHLIKGAGVNVNSINYVEERIDKIVIVMASRLLRDKGVFEYVEAAKIIKNKGLNVEFRLYGDIDEDNPASLNDTEIKVIKDRKFVEVCGFTDDIINVFLDASIIVLPSYREGFPKVLIEAAACGRAIVTTDVPGCRDAIQHNKTGLLCKSRDSYTLASQIEKLILSKKLRNDMGRKGRRMAIEEFDQNKIVEKHFKIIEQ